METGLRPSVKLGAGACQLLEGLRYLATISNGWQPLQVLCLHCVASDRTDATLIVGKLLPGCLQAQARRGEAIVLYDCNAVSHGLFSTPVCSNARSRSRGPAPLSARKRRPGMGKWPSLCCTVALHAPLRGIIMLLLRFGCQPKSSHLLR